MVFANFCICTDLAYRLRAVSFFSQDLVRRMHARASSKAAKRGHARGHLRVSRFARRTTKKRETARSLLCIRLACEQALWLGESRELTGRFAIVPLACVAWQFCVVSGEAAKTRANERPRRLCYFARPTQTAMLRRLSHSLTSYVVPLRSETSVAHV